MMCSAYDVDNRRHYTRNCTIVANTSSTETRSWTSIDMGGSYDGKCAYYDR